MKFPFINRSEELTKVKALVAEKQISSAKFIQCKTLPASGLSSFLKYSASKFREESYSFYVDGSQKIPNSFVSQVLVEMMKSYPALIESFKEYFLKKYPNDLRGKGAVLLSLIPHIGSFAKDYLKESIDYGNLPQLQTMGYPSLIAEMICPFLNSISKERSIVIFVDNAQEIDSWSLEIIETSISMEARNLNYIMGFVNRNNDEYQLAENLFWKINSLGIRVRDLEFPVPNAALVKEFCTYKGFKLPESGIVKIIESADNNIYKIISFIQNEGIVEATDNSLSILQIEILGYLDVAGQPLRKSDMITILTTANHLFINNIEEIEGSIKNLVAKGYLEFSELPDTEMILSLLSFSNPYVHGHLQSLPSQLVRARSIYEYFKAANDVKVRHSPSEITLLLYRLSKKVDPQNTAKWGYALLSLSMKMGSVDSAKRYIDKAILPERGGTIQDYFIKVAFYISVRQYGEALNLLKEPVYQKWCNKRIFKVLLAISYNRRRFHKESESLIQELVATSIHRSELSILLAYSISGHIHENNIDKARQVFTMYNGEVKGATNYGYFLRNAATAFDPNVSVPMLNEALNYFKQGMDDFGYYSTLCNLGKTKCKLGLLKEAETDMENSFEKLKIYGFHHLHVVLNNLGICKLLQQNLTESEIFFTRALTFANNPMPKVYNQINLALLKVYQNMTGDAWEIIKSLEAAVEEFTFDRVRQKFYLNFVFIAYAAGRKKEEISALIAKSEKHPDRMTPDFTLTRLEIIRNYLESNRPYEQNMFTEIVDLCYLEYWYQNPLELLPVDLLAL